MQQISIGLNVLFLVITVTVVFQFYLATNRSKYFLLLAGVWMLLQALIGTTDFYTVNTGVPPRFALMLVLPVLAIVSLFITRRGRNFMDNADIKRLTILHTIRIPVEIGLYYLFVAKTIPEVMTFEGRNFDIIAGVTAPVVFYVTFVKDRFSNILLLCWNIAALLLLFNIITIAFLSLETPVQRFGFGQPDIALAHFPFNWLPSIIVPVVLCSHFITIRQLVTAPGKRYEGKAAENAIKPQ